eukprot:CAMPEP_0176194366 /NCGR_PEP_ID=MMETSP0121_2-20121125/5963_1 /TAXON_ID=160619 /ORGANISM="Kryptoperidinium foliaceum, Strain CCMP 1326" /LENGTH=164 /DNA_ID=CAMNT_0017533109 /DNA_START=129 /DNA_END=623 /DNA_ORIENTATION=+
MDAAGFLQFHDPAHAAAFAINRCVSCNWFAGLQMPAIQLQCPCRPVLSERWNMCVAATCVLTRQPQRNNDEQAPVVRSTAHTRSATTPTSGVMRSTKRIVLDECVRNSRKKAAIKAQYLMRVRRTLPVSSHQDSTSESSAHAVRPTATPSSAPRGASTGAAGPM